MNWVTKKLKIWKRENSFAKDVLALSGSNFAVQVLNLLALPIMTRIYNPSDFGVLGVFSAIVQLITCIATLRYEIPIPNSETNRNAYYLIIVCAVNTAAMTAVTFISIILIKLFEIQFSFLSSLGWFIWLVPVGVLVCSSFNILQFYAIRERQYPMIAQTRFRQSMIAIAAQLGFGLLLKGAAGLILGFILQTGAGGLKFLRHLLSNRAYKDKKINARELSATYTQHSAYFKYSTPEALSQMGALQLPLVIIGAYVNAVEAGLLFMANRIMQLPVGIVSSSFAQVFSGSAAESFKNGTLNVLFVDTVHLMLKYAVVPIFILGIACWSLLPYVLGEEWSRAGEIAIWLMAATTLQSLSSATGVALYVTANERLAFYVQLTGFVLRVFPTAFCSIYFPNYASYVYALSGALHYFLYLIAVSVICKTTKKQYIRLFHQFMNVLFIWMFPAIGLIAVIQLAYR
ncbi:MAG: oligosaccharide flippase family protein [Gallionellaceae bacterium]|nr:oligosaccharide flippase family protein [Gallionellaceae bacterium]